MLLNCSIKINKMKKIILALLLSFVVISAKAQTFSATPADSIETTNDVNDWLADIIYLQNNSGGPLTLSYQTLANTMDPVGWDVLLCTNIGCSAYVPASGSLGTIANGDSAYFNLHTGFVGIAGTGEIKIRVYEVGNPSNDDTITYRYHAIDMTGISDNNFVENAQLSQNFPNPFVNSTVIKYNFNNAPGGKLFISDLQGKKIAEYDLNPSAGEIIVGENMEAGVYIYSLYCEGKMVSTRKMIVQ